jgi:hypothetical protein
MHNRNGAASLKFGRDVETPPSAAVAIQFEDRLAVVEGWATYLSEWQVEARKGIAGALAETADDVADEASAALKAGLENLSKSLLEKLDAELTQLRSDERDFMVRLRGHA